MVQPASPNTAGMSSQQAAWFNAEYESVQKDEILGALLAFFLGSFGAHHFYLGRNKLGILYAVFFWTGIPAICGFVECFLMPGRVRAFNFLQANAIAQRTAGTPRTYVTAPGAPSCHACGRQLNETALFCTTCGAPVAGAQQPTTA